jgi:AcrR family transcriptional regulator
VAGNANSVNITPPRPYHHGNLKAALVEAAGELLAASGPEALSLREAARRVGVSPAAVYRHFRSREELLRALAADGFVRLGDAQQAAADAEADPLAAFNAQGRAYVRFALAHPALFELMFARGSDGQARWRDLPEAARTLGLLRGAAGRLAGKPEARLFAVRAWALAHGLAHLLIDGEVLDQPGLVEAAIDAGPFLPR